MYLQAVSNVQIMFVADVVKFSCYKQFPIPNSVFVFVFKKNYNQKNYKQFQFKALFIVLATTNSFQI